MKKPRGVIRHVVRAAGLVVETRHVAEDALVDPQKSKEISSGVIAGAAALSLPKHSVEIVSFTDCGPLADIVGLGQDILVNDPATKFQRSDGD